MHDDIKFLPIEQENSEFNQIEVFLVLQKHDTIHINYSNWYSKL